MSTWTVIACIVAVVGGTYFWHQFRSPHVLARIGGLERLRSLLKRSPELLDLRDSSGETPLASAAAHGQLPVVSLLINRKANPNTRCEGGGTPLMMAASSGHTDVVRALISAGAQVNAADDDGVTPLHYAASGGHAGTVQALLEHGADVSLLDTAGRTAARVAQERGHASVARLCQPAA